MPFLKHLDLLFRRQLVQRMPLAAQQRQVLQLAVDVFLVEVHVDAAVVVLRVFRLGGADVGLGVFRRHVFIASASASRAADLLSSRSWPAGGVPAALMVVAALFWPTLCCSTWCRRRR
jgi:hypothetical protein